MHAWRAFPSNPGGIDAVSALTGNGGAPIFVRIFFDRPISDPGGFAGFHWANDEGQVWDAIAINDVGVDWIEYEGTPGVGTDFPTMTAAFLGSPTPPLGPAGVPLRPFRDLEILIGR